MLGPALSQLFVDLDERKNRLTAYEKAIHSELFLILLKDQIEKSALTARTDVPVGLDGFTTVQVSGNFLQNLGIPGGVGDVLRSLPNLKVQVDLSGGGGWGDSRRMQIACDHPDCPNKVL